SSLYDFSTVGSDIKTSVFWFNSSEHPRRGGVDFLLAEKSKVNKEFKPALILCNPPFNGMKPKLAPEIWLDKIIELFGKEIPIVLFVPMGFRANLTLTSKRKMKFENGTYPPINYNKIKPLITQRKISQFVNQAVEKELTQHEKQAKAGLRERLIAAHQRMAKNKQLKKELANEWNDLIAVVPMTTDNVDKVEPFEVFIKNTAETGLKEPSKIQLIYPMTIDKELRLVESAQSAPPLLPDTTYQKPAPPP
ncbi:2613_t:CDS:2, partial [Cetraspora pellucida]